VARDQSKPAISMVQTIREHLLESLDDSVSWFYTQMPGYYFRVTPLPEQARHLEVVHALRRAQDARLTLIDDGEAGKLLFFGRPDKHTLLDVVEMLGERPFHRIELHTSRDKSLFIYAFIYGITKVPEGFDLAGHRTAIIVACGEATDSIGSATVKRYLDAVDQGYLASSSVDRVERHVRAWAALADTGVYFRDDEFTDAAPVSRLLIAAHSNKPWQFIVHLARVIKRYQLHLGRGYLDWVPAFDGKDRVLISTLYVTAEGGRTLPRTVVEQVREDLEGVSRLYQDHLTELYQDNVYSLQELEILRAALGFAGQLLAADYPYLDVPEVGEDVIRLETQSCRDLCELLALRFQPGKKEGERAWQKRFAEVQTKVKSCESISHAVILEAMLNFIAAVQLTNVYRPGRLGCSFKVDPAILPQTRFPQRPYGLFSFSSHNGRGFHVRFRPSARGGLRLLLPRNQGQYQRARDGLLKEVYDLAWAQQLKNKDIPEGGSKCIALAEPGGDADAVVKQIVDPLIDLILPADLVPEVIGPHGAEREGDLVFLGPDENMTPDRILWVAARARDRGLPHHLTLMSSKPGSGINHKQYGVTSEGIMRWIQLVLPIVGIGDKTPYTVKMTGGPDGDVGGNLLRILNREHGNRCKVVAICDGTGFAQDPHGLAWGELMRLVTTSLGISSFDPSKLTGEGARVVAVTDKASEQQRNALHNVVEADLFIPCGGRPYAINDTNWRDFLKADGVPNAKAMVEGANIFLTPTARRSLEDAGLVVIKDSSANKGGVICSSYEVLAGLVLSEEEFIANKARYVAEVITILCRLAEAEGRSLLAAWKRRGRSTKLSELSQAISEEINRVSGLFEAVIEGHLDDAEFADSWRRHLEAHCPPMLVDGYRDRIHTRIPRAHRVAILSKHLASTMVYREGLTWCRGYLQGDRMWEVLSTYLSAEREVRALVETIGGAKLVGDPDLISVISAGSQRELVRRRLGQEF
jgi:glutamate dehydrogenase